MNRIITLLLLVGAFATIIGCAVPRQAAKVDLGPWPPGSSPQEVGERVAENFLSREHVLTSQDSTIHYSEACAWYGALTFARLEGDEHLQVKLIKRYESVLDPANSKIVPAREHVESSVFGIVPLEIYIETKDRKYLSLGMEIADKQWENPISGGLSKQTRFWIDDAYMISSLQTQAYRATGDTKYLDRAALEMVAYLDKLQQTNGLFLHGPKGPYYWGRGNGWMAAGMTELLRELPENHPQRVRIMEGYRKMMAALLATQDRSGMWHQLLDAPGAWPETSCTGMFTFALITGVKNGWLDQPTYAPAARKAWLALVSFLDKEGNARNVCAGMGQKPAPEQYLGAGQVAGDFRGQAPILWCASALMR